MSMSGRSLSGPIDVGPVIESQSNGRYAAWILVACAAAMVVEGYDVQVVAYAAPAIIRDWHIDKSLFGPIFGAALFGYLLGATVLSGLGDTFGRKRVIVFGNLFFGVLTLASGFATTVPVLLGLRFVAGLGLGCSIPAAVALGVEYAPEGRRAFRVSLLFFGYTLGAALGGILTAWLMTLFGWRSAFFFGGGVSLLMSAVAFLGLPESARFLATLGGRDGEIAAVLRRLRPDLSFPPGVRFTAPEHRGEHRSEPGVPVRHLFTEGRARMTVLLWAAFVTSLMGHYFLTSWLPTVLDGEGLPLADAVIAGALIQGGGALGSLVVGWLVDRVGVAAIVVAYILSVPFVVLIGAVAMPEPVLMGVVFLAGTCLLGGQVGINSLAGTVYPTFIRSSGAGWALGVGRVGSILGPVIGGLLIGEGMSMPALFACAAVPSVVCAVAVAVLGAFLPGRSPGVRGGGYRLRAASH